MKYCLSSRLSKSYLEQADEIKVQWRDRRAIPDFAMQYPKAAIILQFLPSQITEEIDWDEIRRYSLVCQGRLICCLNHLDYIPKCRELDIKYYWGYPVSSFYELRGLKQLGVCYVRLAPPLFFSMEKVSSIRVPVRLVPNVAYDGAIPHANGIYGQWIRPEDVALYEPYVDTFEFEDADIAKEEALFRIYGLQQGWAGDLSNIITNLNAPALSPLIPEEVVTARLNCGQRCQGTSGCNLCGRAFSIAQPGRLEEYAKQFNLI